MLQMILLAFLAIGVQGLDLQECVKKADIAFVIDSSSSIWAPHFRLQKEFVKKITRLFPIGPDEVQIAALTFGDQVNIEFDFQDFDNVDDIVNRINLTEHAYGSTTDTFDALSAMRTELFSTQYGAREGVPHICILLTDGASSDKTETISEASLAKAAGIEVFALGVGLSINEEELQEIVSDPLDDHLFIVKSFGELNTEKFQNEMINTTCKAIAAKTTTTTTTEAITTTTEATTTTTEATTTTTEASTTTTTEAPIVTTTEAPITTTGMIKDRPDETCQGKEADIVFVVDRSASIWVEFYKKQMQFVADVLSHFDIKSGKTRVALVTFSETAKVEFYLNTFHNKDDMIHVIHGLKETSGITNTHLALNTMMTEVLSKKHGTRKGIVKICILITDGRSSQPKLTVPQVERVHDKGVYVFAIGVGNMTDRTELEQMASKPTKDFMFQVNGYLALPRIKNMLAAKTCEVPRGDEPKCAGHVSADIVFGLHGIGGGDREHVIEFAKSIGGAFQIEKGQIRLGMQENCGQASIDFSESEFSAEFVELVGERAQTPIADFLDLLRAQFGRLAPNSKRDRIVILLVSGGFSDIEQAYSAAYRLKHVAKVIVVGVGEAIATDHLVQMATYRKKFMVDKTHMFHVATGGDLQGIVRKLLTLICNEQK